MVADTILVVLVCIMPAQQPKENSNRFRPLFEQADSSFNSEYKLDIEALKAASKQAVKTADEKTKVERDRVMSLFKGINFFGRKEEK